MSSTFPRLLLQQARQRPDVVAIREKRYGIWQTMNWHELSEFMSHMACGLHEAGLRRGEHVAVIGSNRIRLYGALLAIQALGAIPVPMYEDSVAAEYAFPINNAGMRFALVEDQEQVDKLLQIREQCPTLQAIYYDEPRGLRNYSEPGLASSDVLLEAGQAFLAGHPGFIEGEIEATQPGDVASMFFTSGTTGTPKGVVHTYFSLISSAQAGADFDGLTSGEEVLAYLPPAWIGQIIFSYAQWLLCGYVVSCPEAASTVDIDLKEIGPTYFFAPPRVFEARLTSILIRMEDAGWVKRTLFAACMRLARRVGPRRMNGQSVNPLERLMYGLGDLLVYGPLRNSLGFSRIRIAYTAGEAIGPDLFTFYRSIGINLKQLYGMTEAAVFVCLQPDHDVDVESVGVPVKGVELKVADNGEILVRSPGMFKEYYKEPAATAEVLGEDGWYHTSDAGYLDDAGRLHIIDRVKDVGRLSGGANDGAMFAPKYIENMLKFYPQIKEAVAYGHGRERVCVMLNIDYEAVGNWAERRGLPYTGYTDLAQKVEVYELMQDCVEKVNQQLSRDARLSGSQIHRFLVLHKELDADDGELTRTNKVRRKHIEEKYRPLVDALYGGLEQQDIETTIHFEDGRSTRIRATLSIRDARTVDPASSDANGARHV
ncbi:long-chain fatty acid--CoA ligase [Castellaniella sp.]|uniref:AMP-dependent synthetase/ligase n=1 Tax=Castellaniella sp. TaxID=1955812 RepID=UPI00355E0C0D